MTKKRTRTSYTLSDEGRDILSKLADKYAITQTAMLEVIIREKAKQEGLWDKEPASDIEQESIRGLSRIVQPTRPQ
jgi:hypothetical protein